MHAAKPRVTGDQVKLSPIPVIGSARTSRSCPPRPRVALTLARTASANTPRTATTGDAASTDPSSSAMALSTPTTGMIARLRRCGGMPKAAAGTTPIPKATASDRSNGATTMAGTAKSKPRPNRDHRQLSPARSSILSTSAPQPPARRSTRPPPLVGLPAAPTRGASLGRRPSVRQGASSTSPW